MPARWLSSAAGTASTRPPATARVLARGLASAHPAGGGTAARRPRGARAAAGRCSAGPPRMRVYTGLLDGMSV
eukprot:6990503-Prymnesium_polylepis.1